ncbi:Ig-like protein group 4 [Kribbella antiqua]|uniref:Ig-like protein group 4 n=1 Tax=Kribbella antiqua TaxID=2512217 RepID=A0A4R2IH04_9ACTN|nr:glycoside hydrolase family 43 protein [Kribbella antiqua]TCO44063.1 Ig-like protein group 4 [Kribbella antiqua]
MKRLRFALAALLMSVTASIVSPASAATQYESFRPGAPWLDTNGNVIQAHGGQVVPARDDDGRRIYYWYGEDRSKGYYDSPGVHLYSSYDLYNWKDEGLALRALSSPDQFETDKYFAKLYGGYTAEQKDVVWRDLSTNSVRTDGWARPSILERPKVIYNAKTGKWVMWVHSDGPSSPTSTSTYARAEAGVAIANSPKGPFRWLGSYRLNRVPSDSVPWCGTSSAFDPSGGMARDMNLFVDDDGTAYIIYSSEENRTMYISKLNSSYTYLSAAPENAVQGKDFVRTLPCSQREAPAMFKSEGTYYLVTSGATGWDPNPARYATSQNVLGQFTDRGNPISGDGAANTYRSQSTNVIPVDRQQNKFIFMGDRWTPSDLANAPYVWMPMSFGEGGSLTIGPDQEWTLNDLKPYTRWTVSSTIPDNVWLNDTSTLPTTVTVTTARGSQHVAVTWDASTIAQPGPANLRGTLSDGRTFTRPVVVVPHGLRYAVNAGGTATPDWTRLTQVASTEQPLLNSSPEQPLGTDPVSGTTWGYTGASAPAGTGDLYTTLRYAKNHEPLVYTFDGLEPGSYTVHAGYYDPWPWANRAAEVSVNGTVVDPQRLFTATPSAAAYPATVGADGKVTVTITPTRSPDIQISWLMIARNQ